MSYSGRVPAYNHYRWIPVRSLTTCRTTLTDSLQRVQIRCGLPESIHVYIYAPSEDLLAGRVSETARSAAPGAEVTLTTDTTAGPADRTDDRVVVVLAGPGSAAIFQNRKSDRVLALVLPDGSVPESVPRVDLDPAAPESALESLAA